MNKPISYPLAKLLKEKGFLEDCENEYDSSGKLRFDHTGSSYWVNKRCNDSLNIFSAPTIADVIMWLYEKYGIWISAHQEKCVASLGWDFNFVFIDEHEKSVKEQEVLYKSFGERTFNSPTEAYEAAIEYTLSKLI